MVRCQNVQNIQYSRCRGVHFSDSEWSTSLLPPFRSSPNNPVLTSHADEPNKSSFRNFQEPTFFRLEYTRIFFSFSDVFGNSYDIWVLRPNVRGERSDRSRFTQYLLITGVFHFSFCPQDIIALMFFVFVFSTRFRFGFSPFFRFRSSRSFFHARRVFSASYTNGTRNFICFYGKYDKTISIPGTYTSSRDVLTISVW